MSYIKLYHYIHCPFCVRVRMAAGFLKYKVESVVLPYADEKTPIELTGVKMLPIAEFNDGHITNESLDIIARMDNEDQLSPEKSTAPLSEVNSLLDAIGKLVHNMAMPYWIWTPEFDPTSREYFQKKKEAKRGPFKDLVQQKALLASKLTELLESELENKLIPFYRSQELTISDIMIASHLWGMYIVPEFQFAPEVHSYLQNVSRECEFNYHEDYWK